MHPSTPMPTTTTAAPLQPPTGDEMRRVIARAAELPTLTQRYAHLLDDGADVTLRDLPVVTKDDFRSALPDLLSRARRDATGALVFGSGGTTAAPKLSLIPSAMFVPDIVEHWRPLAPDDVLVNCNNPGELGSMYPFYNMLCHGLGAVVVPLGAIATEAIGGWLDFLADQAVTAIGATPSYVARLLEECERGGHLAPRFRKILWSGEPYGERALGVTQRMLPDVELHGVYGSTETWVIGHNGPSCAVDTFHVLPYQHVELMDGLILVTNSHPQCVNPIVRYLIGDRGEFVRCSCGRPERALRVLGRDDEQINFHSILVTPEEIADVVRADAAVRDVQLALIDHGAPTESIEARLLLVPGADPVQVVRRVREGVLSQLYRVAFEVADLPEAFVVRAVDQLSVNDRTNKTPLVVKESTDRARR